MTIPLVGQFRSSDSPGGFLRSGFGISTRSNLNNPLSQGSFRIQQSGARSEDAVTETLSEKSTKTEDLGQDDRGVRIGGFIGSALKEIKRLADRLEKLNEKKNDPSLSLEQKTYLEEEVTALGSEIERIVTSDPFKKAAETAQTLENVLGTGLVNRRSIQGAAGLLGDDFLNLAAGGASGAISSINDSIRDISGVSAAALINDPTLASKISSLADKALGKLTSKGLAEKVETVTEQEKTIAIIEAPRAVEQNFQAAGAVALSFKTYEGKDLIRAVASGVATSADDLFQLTLAPPKRDDEDDENATEEVERERLDQRSSARNGINVEEPQENSESSSES